MRTKPVQRPWPGLFAEATAGAAAPPCSMRSPTWIWRYGGRPAGTTPERTIAALAKLGHLTVPGSGDAPANRLSGLGALTGNTAGIGMAVVLGLAYALGWWPGPTHHHAGRHRWRIDRH